MTQPSDHELGYVDIPYWPEADPTPLPPNDGPTPPEPWHHGDVDPEESTP